MEIIITIAVLLYAALAIYVGWKIMTGRIAWLDKAGTPNRIVKITISVAVGFVLAGFYVIFWAFRRMAG